MSEAANREYSLKYTQLAINQVIMALENPSLTEEDRASFIDAVRVILDKTQTFHAERAANMMEDLLSSTSELF